jgi:DTW domain-containing protein YfiP
VTSRAQFVVLQHALEAPKTTNTGRIATLALEHALLGTHGGERGDLDLATLDLSRACVLFPGGAGTPPPDVAKIVVLDGTWSQARRMLQRIPILQALPKLSVVGAPGGDRLRQPHFAGGLSTLEAIAEAVRLVDGDAPASVLHALHRTFVARIRSTRGPALARPHAS